MKIEIIEKKENPLQNRIEVHFVVDHVGETTPGRNAVAEDIAKSMKSKRDCVVIDNIESVYGIGKSKGYAKVYPNKNVALELESEYLLKRNEISKDVPVEEKTEAPVE